MRVLIVSNFPGYLDGSYNDRFVYLAKLLVDRGHDVELLTSDFCHDNKLPRQQRDIYPFRITYLHETPYPRNVCLRRLLSHHEWGENVKKYLKTRNSPDVVYCMIPSLTASKYVSEYCQNKHIPFVVDLQDLWPEAFAMAINNRFIQRLLLPMKWYVDSVYASADCAVAVSETYVDRILEVNKKIEAGLPVYLGNDGAEFEKGRDSFHLQRDKDEIVIGYVGNMSTSYDIPCVLDALAKVKIRSNVTVPIRFVLIGGGVDEEKFKAIASKTYSNTIFLGKHSYQEMAGMLCDCDIVVNPIIKGSVASIINKVGDYALSGLPVINTQDSVEYRRLVDDYMCGINCKCGDSEEVADAIERLAINESLRKTMGKNARRLAMDKFDRRYTYERIVETIEQIGFK